VSRRGALLFVGLCVVWGIPYLLIKLAVAELSPVVLVSARTLIAGALLLPLALARGVIRPLLPHWRPLLAFTTAETVIPWGLLSDAERHLSSSLTGLLVAAVPLVGALLAVLQRGGERPGPVNLAGLLLGLVGVVALVGFDVHGTQALAVVEMVVVAIGYAAGPAILTRWLGGQSGLGVITVTVTCCALVYTPFALASLPHRMPSGRVVAAVLVLAVLCTAIAFLMLFALVEEVGPVRTTVITYVNPAVAVAAGVLLLDEPFTPATAAGFGLIVAGSVLATRSRRAVAPEPVPVGRTE
jgi:drug/metabolite transporter (DMT)-like permease